MEGKTRTVRFFPTETMTQILAIATDDQKNVIGHMADHYLESFRRTSGEDPASIAFTVHQLVDEIVQREVSRSERRVSCGKGCSACCHLLVEIWMPEAILLKEAADQAGVRIDRERLKRQQGRNVTQWTELSKEDRRCVFLGADDSCQVYHARPNACRKYHVVSDPKLCDAVEKPGAIVDKLVSWEAEVIESAALTTHMPGPMADLLLLIFDNHPQPD